MSRAREGAGVAAKMKSWPDLRARYAAGVWAAPFALLPGFLLSAAFGQPSPLEPLAQLIIQLTPVAAANVLLNFFGPLARPLALLGALAICLPFAGCCGMLAPGRAPRWRWTRWALSGALALAGAGVLALGADEAAGVWPALLAGVCFLPAFWLVRGFRQPAPSLAGRRRALKTLAGAALSAASIATIGAYQFWSSLGQSLLGRGDTPTPLFPFRAPASRGPGFPMAGLAPEVTPAASFYYNSKNTTDPVIPTDTWKLSVGGSPSTFSSRKISTSIEALAYSRSDCASFSSCDHSILKPIVVISMQGRLITSSSRIWTVFSSIIREPPSQASATFCASWSCGPAAGPKGVPAGKP